MQRSALDEARRRRRNRVFMLSSYGSGTPSTPAPSMIPGAAWWKFDESSGTTVADSSGHGNTGTASAGVTWLAGKIGNAANFSSAYVQVADSPTVNFTGDFTIAVWVKSTQAPVLNQYPMLAYKQTFAPQVGFEFSLHNSTDARWYGSVYLDATGYSVFGIGDVANGAWHHLAFIRQGSTLYSYQDGALAQTKAASASSISNTGTLFLGARNTTPQWPYAGDLDDMRFYNRALSAIEVQALASI